MMTSLPPAPLPHDAQAAVQTAARLLTPGERTLVASVFGSTVKPERVTVRRQKWWFGQPASITMAPDGHIWFHPKSKLWRSDFSRAHVLVQAFFLHEMTHVWQVQTGMNLYVMRPPWARYNYLPLVPGRAFEDYGVEQQAEIVRHYHLLKCGEIVEGAPPLAIYERLLPFLPRQK